MEETEVPSAADTSTQTEESEINYQTTVFEDVSAARARWFQSFCIRAAGSNVEAFFLTCM